MSIFAPKPAPSQRINSAHPLAKGLTAAWVMNTGGGSKIFDASGRQNLQTQSLGVWEGDGLNCSATNFECSSPNAIPLQDRGTAFFFATRVKTTLDWPNFSSALNVETTNNDSSHEMLLGAVQAIGVDTRFYPNYDESSGDYWEFPDAGDLLPWQVPTSFVAVWNNGSRLEGYKNGILSGSLAGDKSWTSSAWSGGERTYIFQNQTSGGRNFGCIAHCCYIWNRDLSSSEMKQLASNPYAMFQREEPKYYVPAAAGGLSIPVAMHHYTKNIRSG